MGLQIKVCITLAFRSSIGIFPFNLVLVKDLCNLKKVRLTEYTDSREHMIGWRCKTELK